MYVQTPDGCERINTLGNFTIINKGENNKKKGGEYCTIADGYTRGKLSRIKLYYAS